MEAEHNEVVRRKWMRPALEAQSTLTSVTQLASPVPMSLLFLQVSQQCFDSVGNPQTCPQ